VSLSFASICFFFLITRLTCFSTFLCLFSCFVFLFSILCILCFCIVLCVASCSVYSCLFPIFVQVYRPLPPGGKQITANKYRIIISYHITSHYISYRIIYHIYHIILYILSCRVISYHIMYVVSYIIIYRIISFVRDGDTVGPVPLAELTQATILPVVL
jgi:hypothetical protein